MVHRRATNDSRHLLEIESLLDPAREGWRSIAGAERVSRVAHEIIEKKRGKAVETTQDGSKLVEAKTNECIHKQHLYS